ncbi:hypothetical protein ACQEU5_24770 [Marinactinospora thermotolerans]|uniref:hypothetical protein n=1 Tax=Marinactinospora thermotolerans TaxID=531310 RepID=UPI003D942B41
MSLDTLTRILDGDLPVQVALRTPHGLDLVAEGHVLDRTARRLVVVDAGGRVHEIHLTPAHVIAWR